MKTPVFLFFALLVVLLSAPLLADINTSNLNWGVQYLIDNSQTVLGQSQAVNPRDDRGLAVSPDGRYLYAGYNNSFNSTGEVRKIDLTVPDYTNATAVRLPGVRGKSIAVDDAGRVYCAEATSIKVYDGNLAVNQYNITGLTDCEGLAVKREGGVLALYGTDRNNGTVSRWVLSESGGAITGAAKSYDRAITGASSLRGLEVDASGRIWMADNSANKVFRIDADGTGLASATVTKAMDVGIDGGQIFVTGSTARQISVLDGSLSLMSTITVPWAALELAPTGQSGGGALSGIVVVPGKGFYVTNETGQTANEKSTYGRTDTSSGLLDGKFYTDLHADDNDPILTAMTPEPSSLLALGLGLAGLVGLRRRRK